MKPKHNPAAAFRLAYAMALTREANAENARRRVEQMNRKARRENIIGAIIAAALVSLMSMTAWHDRAEHARIETASAPILATPVAVRF